MGSSLCTPSCIKNNEGTVISVKSSCFEKPLKIVVSDDDDDMLEHLDAIIKSIHRKKTMIKQKRLSEIPESLLEPQYDTLKRDFV